MIKGYLKQSQRPLTTQGGSSTFCLKSTHNFIYISVDDSNELQYEEQL